MERKPMVLDRSDWARDPELWSGRFEGGDIGTNVTLGSGPPLHVHPYDEIFIIRQGRARFTIGELTIEATAGQILYGPANVPHKFENLGPGRFETTDIHLNDRFVQTDLE